MSTSLTDKPFSFQRKVIGCMLPDVTFPPEFCVSIRSWTCLSDTGWLVHPERLEVAGRQPCDTDRFVINCLPSEAVGLRAGHLTRQGATSVPLLQRLVFILVESRVLAYSEE